MPIDTARAAGAVAAGPPRTSHAITPEEAAAVAAFRDWDDSGFAEMGFGPAEAADIIYGAPYRTAAGEPATATAMVESGQELPGAQAFEPVTPQEHAAVAAFAEHEDDGFGAPGTVEQEVPGAGPRTYRGEILPFEENLETGEFSWAVPRSLDFAVNAARIFTGQVDPQSEEGERALFELALNMGPGGLAAAARRSGTSLGIFGGRHAKTADHEALAKAKEMQKRGVSREEIWRETGWFQGDADGKWRHEIDDSAARFKDLPSLKGKPAKAEDVFDHKELYAAYPALKHDVTFRAEKLEGGVLGTHDPMTRTVAVDIDTDKSDPRAVALHELQHDVQDIEKFSPGGSEKRARNDQDRARRFLQSIDRELAEIRKGIALKHKQGDRAGVAELRARQRVLREDMLRIDDEAFSSPQKIYRDFPGEREAATVVERMDYTPEQRRAEPPWVTEFNARQSARRR